MHRQEDHSSRSSSATCQFQTSLGDISCLKKQHTIEEQNNMNHKLAGDPIHFLKIGLENKKKQDDKGDHTEVGARLPSPLILSK